MSFSKYSLPQEDKDDSSSSESFLTFSLLINRWGVDHVAKDSLAGKDLLSPTPGAVAGHEPVFSMSFAVSSDRATQDLPNAGAGYPIGGL